MKKTTILKFILFSAIMIGIVSCKTNVPEGVTKLRKFISENWKYSIRTNLLDTADLIGLPKPYSTPSINDKFMEMYYWDTYFTNVGLIIDGNIEQAKNNIENVLFLIDKFGYMPNGNRTYYLFNSQPPYASMMVRDVFEHNKDKAWLKKQIPTLEKEYNFWMTKRIATIGLNHYSNKATDAKKLEIYYALPKRLGKNFDTLLVKANNDRITIGSHFYAECESGWDFSPRFDSRCENFCPLDLNCLLYMNEQNMAYFYNVLGIPESSKWNTLAENRKKLINKYLYNPSDSLFYDYDFVNNKLSPIFSASIMNTLWSNLATKEQAEHIIKFGLPRLEFKYGITTCEPGERKYSYQWDHPNGWANIQYLTIKGLSNYGYNNDAKRVAQKYVTTVTICFEKTKNLWEKYNIVDGSINTNNEYGLPTLMGWTAGVYVYSADLLYK